MHLFYALHKADNPRSNIRLINVPTNNEPTNNADTPKNESKVSYYSAPSGHVSAPTPLHALEVQ